jgi:hypothetical protein
MPGGASRLHLLLDRWVEGGLRADIVQLRHDNVHTVACLLQRGRVRQQHRLLILLIEPVEMRSDILHRNCRGIQLVRSDRQVLTGGGRRPHHQHEEKQVARRQQAYTQQQFGLDS